MPSTLLRHPSNDSIHVVPNQSLDLEIDAELVQCYADPLRYVRFMWPWGEFGGPLAYDTGPEPWQSKFLKDLGAAVQARAFDGHTPVMPIQMAIASGNGSGKTALAAWICHWLMDTRPDCKIRVTANTMHQLETATWAGIQSWGTMKLTAARWHITSQAMYPPGDRANWFCVPLSCKEENAQAFAGLHNRHSTTAFIFDEASTIADGVIDIAKRGMTDGEPMMFLFGNPSRRSGQLYRAVFGSERDHWNQRIINGDECEHSNKQLYAEWRTLYGDDSDFVRVGILGLPPNADELQYIDHARVLAAQTNSLQVIGDEPLVCGVDVSGGGDSMTVCFFRRGFDARTIPPKRWTGQATMADERMLVTSALADILADERPTHKVAAMFIDSAFGAVIVSRLRSLGFRQVHEVNFGGPSPDEHDENARASMWRRLKEWLPTAAIDAKNQRLADDLEGPGYHINRRNRLVLEAKDSMKKRGIASPDDGDALALTFAQPVRLPMSRGGKWLPVSQTWQA